MKSIVFCIPAGKLNAQTWWKPVMRVANTVEFIYTINEAARYDYNNVINTWNRITGVSDCMGNRVSLDFRNGPSGVVVSVCFRLFNGEEKREMISNIMPGISCKVSITKDAHFFTLSHTAFESRVDYTCLHHSKRILPFFFLRILPPRMGGLFTLSKDLVVKLILK